MPPLNVGVALLNPGAEDEIWGLCTDITVEPEAEKDPIKNGDGDTVGLLYTDKRRKVTANYEPISPAAGPLPTAVLVARAQAGSRTAFSALVDRFETRVFNFLLRRTSSRSDAEDLTQEAFVRAWLRIDRYRARWAFSTWLFTLAARLAATHERRRRRDRALEWTQHAASDPREDPARIVADGEACAHLWLLADRLLGDGHDRRRVLIEREDHVGLLRD